MTAFSDFYVGVGKTRDGIFVSFYFLSSGWSNCEALPNQTNGQWWFFCDTEGNISHFECFCHALQKIQWWAVSKAWEALHKGTVWSLNVSPLPLKIQRLVFDYRVNTGMIPLHAVIIALRNALNCIIPFLRHFTIISFRANKCAIEVEKTHVTVWFMKSQYKLISRWNR